jgi:hypothetical protein
MSVPVTVIAAGFAVAGGVVLVTGLRRPRDSCEQFMSALAARCADLQTAEERIRVAGGHHDSVDATLRTALAEPAAHVPDGPLAPALQTLRREHHHARDQWAMARAAAAEAQRRYDEARAAVPSKCGACPPCVTAKPA